MIKNKYVWFDQERVGQGSTSPLRDARSLLKERNTSLLSVPDVVFSSFNPKSLTADKSCQVSPARREQSVSQARGTTSQRARGGPGPAPASERGGRDRVAALPGRLHALERQRGGDVAAVRGQRGASSVLPAVARHVAGRGGAVRHVR